MLASNCEIHDHNCASDAPSRSRTTAAPSSRRQRARTLSLPETRAIICHWVEGVLTGCAGEYTSGFWAVGGSHKYSSARGEISSRQMGVSGERKTWLRNSTASFSEANAQTNVRVCRGRGKTLKFAPVMTASDP